MTLPTAAPAAQAQTRARPRRLYSLDGLRLIAALMVVAFHFIGFDNWSNSPWDVSTSTVFPTAHVVASYGWLGCQLFFLISGFVICLSCGGRSLRQFAVSRVTRLYPAYWFAVLATSAVLLFTHGSESGITPSKFLSNLTMLQEPMGAGDIDPVYWTLWAEMRFYLLFAATVAVLGLTYRRVVYFCAAWLLLSTLAPHSGITLLQLMGIPDAAPFFIGGIVIFLMHHFRPTAVLWLLLAASWMLAQNQLPGACRRRGRAGAPCHRGWA